MSIDCRRCDGEGVFPAWYANDSTQKVRYSLDVCECTGFEPPHLGERKITLDEFKRLQALWADSKELLHVRLQAAA